MFNFLTINYNYSIFKVIAFVDGFLYTTSISGRDNNKFFIVVLKNFFMFNKLKMCVFDIIFYSVFSVNFFEKNSLYIILYGLFSKGNTPCINLYNFLLYFFLNRKKVNIVNVYSRDLKFNFYVFSFGKIVIVKILFKKNIKFFLNKRQLQLFSNFLSDCCFYNFIVLKLYKYF